jgi:F-type H+-transporting ATPase subunit delta
MSENIAKRYSVALFEAGKEHNKIDSFFEQIKDVAMILSDYKELVGLLTHPNIEIKDKKNVVQEIFQDKVDETIIKLIYLLIDHGRVKEIKLIYEEYKELVYELKGITAVYVTTAVKMTDEELESLKVKLSKRYSSIIEIENTIDETVIGGVYLKVGDEVVDGTVKGSLDKMRREILKHGDEVKA